MDRWLAELGLQPVERAERDGIASRDLLLDGRRRRGLRLTLILDPAVGLVVWTHYAPPLTDNLRRIYRLLLRWNDELPFVKFALAEDERPVLLAEVPADRLDRDAVGLTVARALAVSDLLHAESSAWTERQARFRVRRPLPDPEAAADPAGIRLLERYAEQLRELAVADGEGS